MTELSLLTKSTLIPPSSLTYIKTKYFRLCALRVHVFLCTLFQTKRLTDAQTLTLISCPSHKLNIRSHSPCPMPEYCCYIVFLLKIIGMSLVSSYDWRMEQLLMILLTYTHTHLSSFSDIMIFQITHEITEVWCYFSTDCDLGS